jgi:hypothetical protein
VLKQLIMRSNPALLMMDTWGIHNLLLLPVPSSPACNNPILNRPEHTVLNCPKSSPHLNTAWMLLLRMSSPPPTIN